MSGLALGAGDGDRGVAVFLAWRRLTGFFLQQQRNELRHHAVLLRDGELNRVPGHLAAQELDNLIYPGG